MPCMCGKWFWQGLKLMISTCAIVENHQKEKVQTKALAVTATQGPQMEKPQGLRDRSCGENFCKREREKNVFF